MPIGVISMFYARPFTREHFAAFARMKRAGADVVELLVPEPGELDLRGDPRGDRGCGPRRRAGGAREPVARSRERRPSRARRPASPILRAASTSPRPSAHRSSAARSMARRSSSPDVRRHPSTTASDRRRIDAVVAGLKRAAAARRRCGRRRSASSRSTGSRPTSPTRPGTRSRSSSASDSPAVGVMLDTFHMNMEEFDMASAIRRTGSRLVHFQANENNRGFVGSGPRRIGRPSRARSPTSATRARSCWSRSAATTSAPASRLRNGARRRRDEDRELAASIAYLQAPLSTFAGKAAA